MKARKSVFMILLAMLTVFCVAALVACEKDPPVIEEGPETGVYFYVDGANEVLLTLHDGNQVTIVNGSQTINGKYTLTDGAFAFALEVSGETKNLAGAYYETTLTLKVDNKDVRFYKKGINYTVSFETNGGTAIEAITVENGRTIGNVETTKVDYYFAGWHTDADLSAASAFDVKTPVTGNIKLYAAWSAIPYNVHFEIGEFADALKVGGALVAHGETFTFPVVEISDAVYGNVYVFDGWFTAEEGGKRITDEKGVGLAAWAISDDVEDTVLYAHFENILVLTEVPASNGWSVKKGPAIVRVDEVTIPAEFEGKPIIEIPANAFSVCYTLKSVKIPNTVVTFNYDTAFKACSHIENIEIYDGGATSPRYSSADSAIINNETKTVVYYPMARAGAVHLPEGVEEIDDNVFEYSFITEVYIPASVTYVGWAAFNDASWLEKVEFAKGTAELEIDDWAFGGCVSLKEITLPARLAEFGDDVLTGCSGLENIFVEQGNTLFGSYDGILSSPDGATLLVFPGGKKGNASGAYTIPNNFTNIAAGAFSVAIANITRIYISPSVQTIENNAFKDGYLKELSFEFNSNITEIANSFFAYSHIEKVILSESILSIGTYAFRSSDLVEIVIPEGLQTIADYAFYYAMSLTSVSLPDSVTEIGERAFEGCYAIKTIKLPATITEYKDYFYNCSAIEEFDAPGLEGVVELVDGRIVAKTDDEEVVSARRRAAAFAAAAEEEEEEGVYNVPEGTEEVTKEMIAEAVTEQGEFTKVVFPASVTSIANGAFQNNTHVVEVVFAEGIGDLTIGNNAFRGSKLAAITFEGTPASLVIGDSAFDSTSLVEVELENVKSVVSYAFYGIKTLTSVKLSGSFNSIGAQTFVGCTALESIVLETSALLDIASQAAYNLSNLASVVINASVASIGASAFQNDSALAELAIADIDSLKTIGANAFNKCAFASFVVGKNVTSIGNNAFINNPNLEEVIFAEGGYEELTFGTAFKGATSLKRIKLPERVTTVAQQAFENCTGLEEVILPSTLMSIGNQAFKNCTGIKSIVIPKMVTYFGNDFLQGAFYGWTAEQTIYFEDIRNLRDCWKNDSESEAKLVLLALQDEQ